MANFSAKDLKVERKRREMNEKGYKWDSNNNKYVKMSPQEIRNREKARKKAEKKLATQRKQIDKKIQRTKNKRKNLYKK